MARAATEDPLKSFRFNVTIDGFRRAGFSDISGIERDTEQVKYREGGMNETAQKSAGLTNYGDLTLKRGLIIASLRGGDDDFVEWCKRVHQVSTLGNNIDYRKNLDINQYNALNVKVRIIRVYNAWPTKFKPTTDLNGLQSENLFEELVLANEGWDIIRV